VQLGHGDLLDWILALLPGQSRVVAELAGGLELCCELRESVPDRLERTDWPAKRVTFLRVGEGLLEHQPGPCHGPRHADQPLTLQLPHDLDEPSALLLAEERVGRHANVVQDELGRVRGPHPQLVELPRHREPGRIGIHHEQREPLVAGRLVGPGHQQARMGPRSIGDEHLSAVDDEAVALRATVSMAATSEPAFGSVIARLRIFSPLIAGTR
jgi:hypothetical protein